MEFEAVTANVAGVVHPEKYLGRDYLVAPMTLIVPGVLHGSKGALYYPPSEVSKDVDTWNMMPLVLNHPKMHGRHVTARSPSVFDKYGMGYAFNAAFSDKLGVEGWFDTEWTKRVDERVYYSLKNNLPLELSTGLYTKDEPTTGRDPKGIAYNYVARDYKPDHVAILPDVRGACSVKDGCGMLVNEAAPLPAWLTPDLLEMPIAEALAVLNVRYGPKVVLESVLVLPQE